jgi:hypothetical protein
MRRLCWTFFFALCLWGLFAETSRADTFTYTFELPIFTMGQMTPLLNVAPNIGAGTFTTSFTDTIDPNGYEITTLKANNLISGQSLFSPIVVSPLTLTFSAPVTQLSLVFALSIANTDPAGFLRLVTPTGTLDQASSVVGGSYQGGTLTFTSASAFTTATLQGFIAVGAGNPNIEIDNLALTTSTIPEPASLVLLATGLGVIGLAAWRKRK